MNCFLYLLALVLAYQLQLFRDTGTAGSQTVSDEPSAPDRVDRVSQTGRQGGDAQITAYRKSWL